MRSDDKSELPVYRYSKPLDFIGLVFVYVWTGYNSYKSLEDPLSSAIEVVVWLLVAYSIITAIVYSLWVERRKASREKDDREQ